MFSRRSGFTFIELLIVIALIGIISVVFIVGLDPIAQINKSKDGKRKADLSLIQKIGEDFYNDKNRYADGSEVCYDFANAQRDGDICSCHICGNEASSPQSKPYLDHLICDPDHPRRDYLYQYNCAGSTSIGPNYRLNASLSSVPVGAYNHSVATSDIIPTPTASASNPTSSPSNPTPTSVTQPGTNPYCTGQGSVLFCRDSNNTCNNCGSTYNECTSNHGGCPNGIFTDVNCNNLCTVVGNPTSTPAPTSTQPNPTVPPISK